MGIRQENSVNRNFIRNLLARSANRNFGGQQRICTTKDALAYQESTDMYGCNAADTDNGETSYGNGTAGI